MSIVNSILTSSALLTFKWQCYLNLCTNSRKHYLNISVLYVFVTWAHKEYKTWRIQFFFLTQYLKFVISIPDVQIRKFNLCVQNRKRDMNSQMAQCQTLLTPSPPLSSVSCHPGTALYFIFSLELAFPLNLNLCNLPIFLYLSSRDYNMKKEQCNVHASFCMLNNVP